MHVHTLPRDCSPENGHNFKQKKKSNLRELDFTYTSHRLRTPLPSTRGHPWQSSTFSGAELHFLCTMTLNTSAGTPLVAGAAAEGGGTGTGAGGGSLPVGAKIVQQTTGFGISCSVQEHNFLSKKPLKKQKWRLLATLLHKRLEVGRLPQAVAAEAGVLLLP